MKYIKFFILFSVLGAIIIFLIFVFSQDWQKNTWNRRAKEIADTSKAYKEKHIKKAYSSIEEIRFDELRP